MRSRTGALDEVVRQTAPTILHTTTVADAPGTSLEFVRVAASRATLPAAAQTQEATNPKEVARAIIRSEVNQQTLDELTGEHQRLARKKVLGGLSKSEALDLTMIRWKLDRIRDADSGAQFDRLEAFVGTLGAFAQQVTSLKAELSAAASTKRQKPSPRNGRK